MADIIQLHVMIKEFNHQPRVNMPQCSLAGTAGSNPAGSVNVSCESVACSQVEVSATGRYLVQMDSNESVSWNVIRWNNNPLHVK